mmetsp:Transcript_52694/g.155599  ORF Transcript_52694/g.155599 Transcript_52694/m.155599 type:complete len:201 (+) Transcript_52694:187-789(+)
MYSKQVCRVGSLRASHTKMSLNCGVAKNVEEVSRQLGRRSLLGQWPRARARRCYEAPLRSVSVPCCCCCCCCAAAAARRVERRAAASLSSGSSHERAALSVFIRQTHAPVAPPSAWMPSSRLHFWHVPHWIQTHRSISRSARSLDRLVGPGDVVDGPPGGGSVGAVMRRGAPPTSPHSEPELGGGASLVAPCPRRANSRA